MNKKIPRSIQVAAFVVWSVLLFIAGELFRGHILLGSSYVTTEPLVLMASQQSQEGLIPAGATIYSYGGPDEQPTFVLFVGTKAVNALRPTQPQHRLEISPLVAVQK